MPAARLSPPLARRSPPHISAHLRLQVKMAPKAVDERDDKLLSSLMSTLEQQNQAADEI